MCWILVRTYQQLIGWKSSHRPTHRVLVTSFFYLSTTQGWDGREMDTGDISLILITQDRRENLNNMCHWSGIWFMSTKCTSRPMCTGKSCHLKQTMVVSTVCSSNIWAAAGTVSNGSYGDHVHLWIAKRETLPVVEPWVIGDAMETPRTVITEDLGAHCSTVFVVTPWTASTGVVETGVTDGSVETPELLT